ncbi:hypothetical protein Sango_2860700 [Sesamum angolense]|uniref:Uncharacterized protein n=1 Tax=Sesamum angolense TaxID=2727404 RepID=A0AAE1VZE5_9LAMI|nr:hypothetical protein Sango_2860700 [Sesamum angolense]
MGIDNVRLTLVNTPLTSFSGDIVEPLEEAILPVSLGSHAKRAIASSFQMKIKFPTLNEIEEEIGERKQARECYANTLKKPITASSMKSKEDDKFPSQKRLQKTTLGKSQEKTPPPPPPKRKLRKNPKKKIIRRKPKAKRIEANEEVKMVDFFEDPSKTVKIGSSLDPQHEHTLINFLQNHFEVFACEALDIQGINPKVMVHSLNVNPEARPIKQKKRAFDMEINKIIKEEVEKLL